MNSIIRILLVFGSLLLAESKTLADDPFITRQIPAYYSEEGVDEEPDIQCPVPLEDRVPNFTGIQCVWSSIEMLGRWAEEPKLMNPPLTSRSDCKSFSGPASAARKLDALGVHFEQTTNRREGREMIKMAMEEGRACLWGVPHHAMVLIHYDEENDVVKWVDNSDRSLKIQTCNIDRFEDRWSGWVLVLYADRDVIPVKTRRLANWIPVRNRNHSETLPRKYIPLPRLPSSRLPKYH